MQTSCVYKAYHIVMFLLHIHMHACSHTTDASMASQNPLPEANEDTINVSRNVAYGQIRNLE